MVLRKLLRPLMKMGTKSKCLLLLVVAATPLLVLNFASSDSLYRSQIREAWGHSKHGVMDMVISRDNDVIRNRFKARRRHLQQQCATNRAYYEVLNSENAVKEHLTIDKKHRLVYCAIEKIGSTFWKRVFQILSGFSNATDPFHIQGIYAYQGYLTAKDLPFDKIHLILKSSAKFMFVREPYERLLSGYVDKLFAPNAAYWTFLGTHIVKHMRQNATDLSTKCGHDTTFAEFVAYFVQSHYTNEKRDAHFVPNFEHCRPCEIDYDYIGKLETFTEDSMFLMKELHLDKKVKFDNFEQETEKDAIIDSINYVLSMRNGILKCMSLNEAFFRVYRKLQIRGILSKEIPYPFLNDKRKDIPAEEYRDALLKVHSLSGSPSTRKINRKDAFLEAYSTLPEALLVRLKDVLSIDADLFGYDKLPKSFKNMKDYSSDFKYFRLY